MNTDNTNDTERGNAEAAIAEHSVNTGKKPGKNKRPHHTRGGKSRDKHANKQANNTVQGGKNATMRQSNKSSSNKINTNFPFRVGSNDFAWYNLTPAMVATGANISYNAALGTPSNVGISLYDKNKVVNFNDRHIVPGILSLEFQPVLGMADNGNDPVNMAARSIFSTVRRAINGQRPYEASDIMNYIITVGSLFSAVQFIIRTLRCTRSMSLLNRYSREAIIEAAGFSPYLLETNAANILYNINYVIKQLNLLPIPKSMPLFDRWAWLASNIFLDVADSAKAQIILPNMPYYYEYAYGNGDETHGPVALVAKSLTDGTTKDPIVMLQNISKHVSKLNQDTDIATIAGDLLKTYGPENMYTLPLLTDIVPLEPKYDLEFSAQMNNAVVSPLTVKRYRTVIDTKNETTYIAAEYENQVVVPESTFTFDNTLINTSVKLPTPADNIILSRMVSTFKRNGENFTITSCGSELLVRMKMHILSESDPFYGASVINQRVSLNKSEASADTWSSIMNNLTTLSVVEAHPMVYVVEHNIISGGEVYGQLFIGGDLDNYAWVDNSVIANMNQTVTYSLLGLAEYGAGLLNSKRD